MNRQSTTVKEEDQEEDDEMPTAQKDLEIRVVEVVVAKPNCIDHPKYVVWRINFSKRAIFIAYEIGNGFGTPAGHLVQLAP